MRSLSILGSTGSIGTQALDVVRRNPDRFRVLGLGAGSNQELLVGQIREFMPPVVAIADENAAADLKRQLGAVRGIEVLSGPHATETLPRESDSATLMNKGLEVIEAHYLFGLDYRLIDVVVHPESIIHGIAEFADGSMIAQMAGADMRLPIQLALGYPDRLPTGIKGLDLAKLG